MNTATGALSALRRLTIVIAIAIVFVFGLASTVFLSLRSPEVKVPDVVGKDRFEAERVLGEAGLNFAYVPAAPATKSAPTQSCFSCRAVGKSLRPVRQWQWILAAG